MKSLIILLPGESPFEKSKEIIASGRKIASSDEILLWIKENPEVKDLAPIVIVDSTAKPKVYGPDSDIILIPAHAFVHKGAFHPNGMLDLYVPARKKEESGLIAILESVI